jgi:hypothetical protein
VRSGELQSVEKEDNGDQPMVVNTGKLKRVVVVHRRIADQAGTRHCKVVVPLSRQGTAGLTIVGKSSAGTEKAGHIVDFAAAGKHTPEEMAVEQGIDVLLVVLCTVGRMAVEKHTVVDCDDGLYTVTPGRTASILVLGGVRGRELVPRNGLLLSVLQLRRGAVSG